MGYYQALVKLKNFERKCDFGFWGQPLKREKMGGFPKFF